MRWIALQARSIEPAAMTPEEVQLAICAVSLSFTPRVALCGSVVVMEVSGSLRLFGGLHKLATLLEAHLHAFFKQNGLLAQITRTQAATSLIAIGRLRLLRVGQKLPARVADMPMHTLTATHQHLDVLARMGCRTLGDLLRLPREGVARRFGAPLLAALDQARGALPEAYAWCVLSEQFEQKIELDALVIQAPALMTGVKQLLVRLHAWLLGRQSGLCALKLVWHLDKRRDVQPTDELTVRTAQPAQNLQHVERLIAERLNQVNLSAPVHSITLASLETVSLRNASEATASLLIEPRQQGASSSQFIERLSARLGPASVQVWQAQANHRPEAMQCWAAAGDEKNQKAIKSGATRPSSYSLKILKDIKISTTTDTLFPTWLLDKPLKLATKAGAPLHQGPLLKLAGPQRLEATGWLLADRADIMPALRDYFIYRSSQGVLLWIYSERLVLIDPATAQREWYLHGIFA